MNASLYLYTRDPNTYQWEYRTIAELIIPELNCGINDHGELFEIDTYHAEDRKTFDIIIHADMEHRIRKALNMKKRSKILRNLLLEILLASAIQL